MDEQDKREKRGGEEGREKENVRGEKRRGEERRRKRKREKEKGERNYSSYVLSRNSATR